MLHNLSGICFSKNYFSGFLPFIMNTRTSTIREQTEYLLAQERQRNEIINLNGGVSAMLSTFYLKCLCSCMYHFHFTMISFCIFLASLKIWHFFILIIIFMSIKTN